MAQLKPVLAFASRGVEARFWDTHDLTDYFSFDDPVDIEASVPEYAAIALRIDPETLGIARSIAQEEGVPLEGLLEPWIIERRDQERARRRAS